MPKQSGLGDRLYVGGYDLSGDVGSLSRVGGGVAPIDVTAINKSAVERIGGSRDGGIEFQAWFNPDVGGAHDRLSNLPTADQIVTYCRGTAAGAPAASMVSKQIGYDVARGADGGLSMTAAAVANAQGIEWGRLLTAGIRTTGTIVGVGSDTGPNIDLGVGSTAFGLQVYYHVFSYAGTDATLLLQESSDNGVGDPFSNTVGVSQAITSGPASFRLATSPTQTVERYLRARVSTAAGFTGISWATVVVRNDTAVPA